MKNGLAILKKLGRMLNLLTVAIFILSPLIVVLFFLYMLWNRYYINREHKRRHKFLTKYFELN